MIVAPWDLGIKDIYYTTNDGFVYECVANIDMRSVCWVPRSMKGLGGVSNIIWVNLELKSRI